MVLPDFGFLMMICLLGFFRILAVWACCVSLVVLVSGGCFGVVCGVVFVVVAAGVSLGFWWVFGLDFDCVLLSDGCLLCTSC